MDLRFYIDIFWRRAPIIIIVAALTVAVMSAYSLYLTTPMYKAVTTVRLIQEIGLTNLRPRDDSQVERLANTYSQILTGWPRLHEAKQELNNDLSISQLREKISIQVMPKTELMQIIVTDSDPKFAQQMANKLAELLIEYTQNLYTDNADSARQILDDRLTMLEQELISHREQLMELSTAGASDAEMDSVRSLIAFKENAYAQLLNQYEQARLNQAVLANSVKVVEAAQLPRYPSNKLGFRQVGLSLGLGLFGGIGLALILENLDTRIHSAQQLEYITQLPILGTVPRGFLQTKDIDSTEGAIRSTPVGEAYRLLGLGLLMLREEKQVNTLLVTSAMPKEGKTMVTSNLAQTLAERGRKVFLIEADLRRPSQKKVLDIKQAISLHNLLVNSQSMIEFLSLIAQIEDMDYEHLLQDGESDGEGWSVADLRSTDQSSLFVIPGGPPASNPPMLLATPAMSILLDRMKSQSNITMIDAPPTLGVADVSLLAPMVDGVILIVRQGVTKRENLLAAIRQLKISRGEILGIVFVQKSRRGWKYE